MQNAASVFVSEYVYRKRLAKLGFTTDIDGLDSISAEALILIDSEIDDLQAKEAKKKNGRRK